ncbi:MAG: BtrH N-terminal domain-containing protein, partial [Thermodesulfobacteriota bacterium]
FYSINEKMSPSKSIHLRGPAMEPNFFSIIDKQTEWKFEDDNERSSRMLKNFINHDIPVLIQTDIFYLDYYNSSTHFPGHVVSVWGYDDESREFFLSDTGFSGLKSISYESLSKARSSQAQPYPLRNNWIEVVLEPPIPPLSELIPRAILNNAKSMLEGRKNSRGISSVNTIRLWAKQLKDWYVTPDWQWSTRFAYQVIEKRGTGGGGFRFMYRDFLIEAQEIIPVINELKLVEKMDLLGTKWSDISIILRRISDSEKDFQLFKQVSKKAEEIAELEETFYSEINDRLIS